LNSNVATNTSNIATNTTNIAANTTSINSLNTQVASNTGSINTLNGQVATNTTNIATNTTNIGNLQNQIINGSIGLVQQNPATRAITVGATTDGTNINVAGTSGNRTVTGVTAGALTSASSDAVNGGQLFATNQQVATNTSDIASLNTTVAGLSGSSIYFKANSTGPAASATGATPWPLVPVRSQVPPTRLPWEPTRRQRRLAPSQSA
jgi:hypothetical protein